MTAVRALRIVSVATAVILLLVVAPLAQAAPIVFSGFDAGANDNNPRPNSNAAQAAFSAAAGSTSLITFESAPLGSFTNLMVAPGVTINGSDFGGSPQTIQNAPIGSPDALFGYNTTPGGSHFVSLFGGNLVFTFSTPISSFGAYISGQQLPGETITFNDGSPQSIPIPFASNGGVAFVGFVDTGKSISSITFNVDGDIDGVDDVQFGTGAAAAPVPEPTTLALLGLGVAGLFGWRRWRKV